MREKGRRRAAACLLRAAVIVTAVAAGASGWPPPALTANAAPAAGQPHRPSGRGVLSAAQDLVTQRAAALAKATVKAASLAATAAVLRTKAEVLAEDYDHQVTLAGQAASGYRVAAARLAAARLTERDASRRLGQQAAEDYKADGGPSMDEVVLSGITDPRDFLGALGIQQVIASQRSDLVAASQADELVTRLFAQQAAALLARQRSATRSADQLKIAVAAAVSHQAAAVRQAKTARARLTAKLASAKAGAARLAAPKSRPGAGKAAPGKGREPPSQGAVTSLPASVLAGGPAGAAPGVASPEWSIDAGASAAQGAAAVRWALTQVGQPYQWGGAGPRTYDCSGLAMDAWAKAGVRLAHWTGFQWVSGPHVPLGQLRPGDLVFYATNVADPVTIHHVGIYIGHGRMVDAPYTGAFVRVESIYAYAGLIGVTRPAA